MSRMSGRKMSYRMLFRSLAIGARAFLWHGTKPSPPMMSPRIKSSGRWRLPRSRRDRGLSGGSQARPVGAAAAAEGVCFRPSAAGRRVRSRRASAKKSPPIAKDKPNIDLEITFDYNSADISSNT